MNEWTFFAFPLNLLLALIWTGGCLILWKYRRDSRLMRFLLSPAATISSIVLLVAACLWIGFSGDRGGVQSIVFLCVLLYVQSVLLLVTLRGWRRPDGVVRWRFLLIHAGLLLALGAGFWGAPDSSEIRVAIGKGETVREGYYIDGRRGILAYELTLKDFDAKYSLEHKPVHYEAIVSVDGADPVQITVNHPLNVRLGESICLTSVSDVGCVLQIVREPWRYFTLAGILMLIAGASMLFIKGPKRWVIAILILLLAVFLILIVRHGGLVDTTRVPALQSPWFFPHVTAYVFAYSLLGCAFVLAIVALFKPASDTVTLLCGADALIYIGVALLTFGMLTGSIWAKEAWGHFWSWDPKETWALITWSMYALYIHMRIYRKGSVKLLCVLLIFAFACLQMCWWGINYLPSAAESVHVY